MNKANWHTQQRERIAAMRRKAEARREDRIMQAEQIIARYHDAYRTCFPDAEPPSVEFVPQLGKYKLGRKPGKESTLSEATIIDAATNLYAIAHEKEMGNGTV